MTENPLRQNNKESRIFTSFMREAAQLSLDLNLPEIVRTELSLDVSRLAGVNGELFDIQSVIRNQTEHPHHPVSELRLAQVRSSISLVGNMIKARQFLNSQNTT